MKLVQNTSAIERRFSPWIGGSILASLVSLLSRVNDVQWNLRIRDTLGLIVLSLLERLSLSRR